LLGKGEAGVDPNYKSINKVPLSKMLLPYFHLEIKIYSRKL
jgi:hypothetical protein